MEIQVVYEHNFADAKIVRQEVFVEEQGFKMEFDEIDNHAIHVTLYLDKVLAGCARMYADIEKDVMRIGRIALRKPYRKQGLAKVLVESCEAYGKKHKAKAFVLDAQCRMQGFYERLNYQVDGEIHMDEHVPHVQMRKTLKDEQSHEEFDFNT